MVTVVTDILYRLDLANIFSIVNFPLFRLQTEADLASQTMKLLAWNGRYFTESQ